MENAGCDTDEKLEKSMRKHLKSFKFEKTDIQKIMDEEDLDKEIMAKFILSSFTETETDDFDSFADLVAYESDFDELSEQDKAIIVKVMNEL